jgi:hypothetical protein
MLLHAIRDRALKFAAAMAQHSSLETFDATNCIVIKSESPANPAVVEKFGTPAEGEYLEFVIEIDYNNTEIKPVNERDGEVADFLLRTGMQLAVTCSEYDVIHYQLMNIDLD